MPSAASPCARWNAITAWRVWGPKMPSAGIPSARCAAATAGPRLPKRRLPSTTLVVAVVDCARATCAAGTISVAATQRRRDLAARRAGPPRRGKLAPPQRALERPLPQLVARQVPLSRRLREQRPQLECRCLSRAVDAITAPRRNRAQIPRGWNCGPAAKAAWDAAVARCLPRRAPVPAACRGPPHAQFPVGPDWTALPVRVAGCLGRERALALLDARARPAGGVRRVADRARRERQGRARRAHD